VAILFISYEAEKIGKKIRMRDPATGWQVGILAKDFMVSQLVGKLSYIL
jgi:hypothetical protein